MSAMGRIVRRDLTSAEGKALVSWDYECSRPGCGWSSTGWPTRKKAQGRQTEHIDEHETGIPAPPKELLLTGAEMEQAREIAAAIAAAEGD